MKILVVEDDRKVAGFIEQGLKEEGYVVDVAPDGDEATMLAHVYDYDVILLDVVLPKKNGFQIAAELRREGRSTPILMLTSRDAVEDVVRGLDAGADDYLPKPFRSTSCSRESGLCTGAEVPNGWMCCATARLLSTACATSRPPTTGDWILPPKSSSSSKTSSFIPRRSSAAPLSWKRYGTCISTPRAMWLMFTWETCAGS